MKFKELSDKDKEIIRITHKNTDLPFHKRMDILKDKFDVAERTIRKWISKMGLSQYAQIDNEEIRLSKLKQFDPNKKYKLITWAQNATPIHPAMLENMEAYAKYLGGEILVIAGRYTNPTSFYSAANKEAQWWDERVVPYLCSTRLKAHTFVDVLSDVRIVPTAENPLDGLEGLSHESSCIVGHPRLHLKSVPVLEGYPKKYMLTTGACTLKNYTETKAGIKGDFHHVYAFALVEIKDDAIFYIRPVPVTDEGDFIDLCYQVSGGKVTKISSAAAFVMGDLHTDEVEEDVVKETVRLFKKVRPEKVFAHDLVNGTSVNHHENKDPIRRFEKYKEGRDRVKPELDRVVEFVDRYKLTDYGLHVVASNHHDWFDRWIKESDWKKDIPNAMEYMEYSLALLRGEAPNGVFAYFLDKHYGDKIKCLNRDESCRVLDFELGNHGDLGANGSRGSIQHFRKLNTKNITGDSHTTGLIDGAMKVGTYSILRPGYNKGASSWGWSGAIIHHNKKAQLVIFAADKKCSTLF